MSGGAFSRSGFSYFTAKIGRYGPLGAVSTGLGTEFKTR